MSDSSKSKSQVPPNAKILIKHNGGGLLRFGVPSQPITREDLNKARRGELPSDGGVSPEIMIQPGYNEVPYEDWAKIRQDAWVKYHLGWPKKNPMLEEGWTFGPDETALAAIPAADACEVVRETAKETLLREWQAAETRGDVLTALQERIDEVRPDKKRV